jgi:hypothetical protein
MTNPLPENRETKDSKQWTTTTNITDLLGPERINIVIPKTQQHRLSSQKPLETLQTLNSQSSAYKLLI